MPLLRPALILLVLALSLPPTAFAADEGAIADESFGRVGITDASSAAAEQPLIRVGIYDATGGKAKGPKALGKFLIAEAGFLCIELTPEEIRTGKLAEVDVLIMPGGSGSAQARNLEETGREAVRDFVRGGGGYVGICAGSYLASSCYSWSLHLINAQIVDRAHWARGTGSVTLKISEAGKAALGEEMDQIAVYYGQGPLLAPDDKQDLPSYEALAEYASEIAKKGAPTGVMIGTTAIARSHFGDGRVICFSPHPEVASGPNHLVLQGVKWAAGRTPAAAPVPVAVGE